MSARIRVRTNMCVCIYVRTNMCVCAFARHPENLLYVCIVVCVDAILCVYTYVHMCSQHTCVCLCTRCCIRRGCAVCKYCCICSVFTASMYITAFTHVRSIRMCVLLHLLLYMLSAFSMYADYICVMSHIYT